MPSQNTKRSHDLLHQKPSYGIHFKLVALLLRPNLVSAPLCSLFSCHSQPHRSTPALAILQSLPPCHKPLLPSEPCLSLLFHWGLFHVCGSVRAPSMYSKLWAPWGWWYSAVTAGKGTVINVCRGYSSHTISYTSPRTPQPPCFACCSFLLRWPLYQANLRLYVHSPKYISNAILIPLITLHYHTLKLSCQIMFCLVLWFLSQLSPLLPQAISSEDGLLRVQYSTVSGPPPQALKKCL